MWDLAERIFMTLGTLFLLGMMLMFAVLPFAFLVFLLGAVLHAFGLL